MGADEEDLEELAFLTRRIIGCAMKVSSTLGVGFVERVYENALAIELRHCGFHIEQQASLVVRY